MNTFPKVVLAVIALASTPSAWAHYYIVVSDQSAVERLSEKETLHLFMGRTRAFPNGDIAVAYDLAGANQREGFYRALGGMTLAQVNSYWARLMFSGRSLPPQPLDDEAAMIEKIKADPKAVGWLSEAPKQKGLRTVLVLKDAP